MKVWGFCSDVSEDFVTLGFHAVSPDSQTPTFQSNLVALKCWDPVTLEQNHHGSNVHLIVTYGMHSCMSVQYSIVLCCWSDSVTHPSFRNQFIFGSPCKLQIRNPEHVNVGSVTRCHYYVTIFICLDSKQLPSFLFWGLQKVLIFIPLISFSCVSRFDAL
jgi:hypothetical protein